MAEGWKQVWEDLLNSLRGAPPQEEDTSSQQEDESAVEAPVAAAPEAQAPVVGQSLAEASAVTATESHPTPPAAAEPAIDGESEVELTPRQRRLERLRYGAIYGGLALLLFAGLWFSGLNRQWAQWFAPRPPASDVIATFDGGQITIADVEEHLALLVPAESLAAARTPATLVLVVEDLVSEELVKRWAAERQPDAEADFKHAMQHITEQLNLESFETQLHEETIPISESEIQTYYNAQREQFGEQSLDAVREQIRQLLVAEREQEFVTSYIQRLKDIASITRNYELLAVPAPTEDDLRRYYDENVAQFQLPRQVVVQQLEFPIGADEDAARQEADEALLKLRSGADFVEVSQQYPQALLLVGSVIAEGALDPAWDAEIFTLGEAELSDVFRAGDSFYVARVLEQQPARAQTLDEVRAVIEPVVASQIADEWFEANAAKTLFTLSGERYTAGEFYQEYNELPFTVQAQYSGAAGMELLAEQLIERLLLVEDSYDQLLDVQNQPLEDEARLQLMRQMMDAEEVDDKIDISEEALQQFYDENTELMTLPPQVRIRYIRIGLGAVEDEAQRARERADEAYRKLAPGFFQEGADFATVAQEYSEDPETAANGGELPGWIGETDDLLTELELHPFHEAVLPLPLNQISPPFEFGGSLYIVQVIDRTQPEVLSFEEARPFIEQLLFQQQHDELTRALQESLLEQANLVVYTSVLEAWFAQIPTQVP